ncbi:LysR family transcriptional regulator [Variovorax paradoxus]|jgi:DNA-binding transcriptional LysR family regulator|nr:LysR family transcriptional regulator [Variovorax paradoxus]MBS77891.1 LysR family transcriptional regulator [Variovorax sp.]MCT8175362.1 LysR family transcriptional regulator [Variovorax sp. CY25R-8]KPU97029.1 LysR family transcriptional regulator [Variovorax paradoxus]KPV01196.1 LysR family transcriptional regulator [Variovorax paradoxus]
MTAAAPMDLQILRAFVLAAREGSVSRAAARLHLTQPAVSLQLKRLAEDTGLQLFTRTPHGLALTADGAALLPQAERVLAAVGDLQQAARNLQSTVRGALRIGTILDPEFTRLGMFLRELVESAPQIETELRHGMSGTVLAQVLRGELDVGFHLDADGDADGGDAALAARTLTRFTYRVVAPAGWGPQVTGRDWKALAALPWLATPPESAHHRLLERVFGPLGLAPRRVALVDQEASMLDLLKSGVGLSLLRDSIAIRESQAHGLVLADRVQLDCALRFVSLAARRNEPVIASAWDALTRAWS